MSEIVVLVLGATFIYCYGWIRGRADALPGDAKAQEASDRWATILNVILICAAGAVIVQEVRGRL